MMIDFKHEFGYFNGINQREQEILFCKNMLFIAKGFSKLDMPDMKLIANMLFLTTEIVYKGMIEKEPKKKEIYDSTPI